MNIASRNMVFPWHALSIITASTSDRDRHTGTVIKAYRRGFLKAEVNQSSLHILIKFLSPTNCQFPIPLVKSQFVKLMIKEKIIGMRVKETMPIIFGNIKA